MPPCRQQRRYRRRRVQHRRCASPPGSIDWKPPKVNFQPGDTCCRATTTAPRLGDDFLNSALRQAIAAIHPDGVRPHLIANATRRLLTRHEPPRSATARGHIIFDGNLRQASSAAGFRIPPRSSIPLLQRAPMNSLRSASFTRQKAKSCWPPGWHRKPCNERGASGESNAFENSVVALIVQGCLTTSTTAIIPRHFNNERRRRNAVAPEG